ncbi:hypothetical protein JCM5353_006773, partial [Sporobolomyces roseus]
PFEDGPDKIEPRITAKERKEQEKAKREMKMERAKQREQGKRKGTKNKALLSFGADEEPVDDSAPKTKFKSAHDVATDGRLSAQVIDDRGTSATLPPDFMGDEMRAPPPKKRKGDEEDSRRSEEKRLRSEATAKSASKLEEARALKAKAPKSDSERRKEEIAKVQAELKKMSKSAESEEDEKPKKAKRTGPSLLQLEREKYLKAGAASSAASKVSRGKRKAGHDDEDVLNALDGFRKKLDQASKKAAPEPKADEEEKREKLHGIDLNDDELEDDDIDLWAAASAHSLRFRKDATLDQHNIDEYSVVDPLSKETRTLDEMKVKASNSSSRRYGGDREKDDGDRRGGRSGTDRGGREERGDRGSRYQGGSGGGRDRDPRDDRRRDDRRDDRRDGGGRSGGSGFGFGGRDRPEVQGNWKKDRISTADLA